MKSRMSILIGHGEGLRATQEIFISGQLLLGTACAYLDLEAEFKD